MSTELAVVRDDQQPATFYPTDPTGGRLVAWAEGLAAAHRIGTALCGTAFVPVAFRGKPEEAAAAILYGDEVGFTPTQALQNIYVISGKPGMYARSMVALVLHHGHEVWTVEKSPSKVVVAGRRRGSSHTVEEVWTTDRARRAGYTSNKKYETDPESMLYARAAADVCRQIAPDALAGLAYVVEELELAEAEPTTTVRRESKATARRAPAPEPELEPTPTYEPSGMDEFVEPTEQPSLGDITSAQSKMLHALLTENEMGARDAGLAYISHILGREVETSKSLSKADASKVIDSLKPAEDQP